MKKLTTVIMTLGLLAGCTNLVPPVISLKIGDATSLLVDSDDDGVRDYWDQCRNTPLEASVNFVGCPRDTNGDGLADYRQCGTLNDLASCTKNDRLLGVLDGFGPNDYALSVDAKHRLHTYGDYLKTMTTDVELVVIGHADFQGDNTSNQVLSEKRADAVVTFLKEQVGVSINIVSLGQGKVNPVADNGTAEGRSFNRRVEIYTRITDTHQKESRHASI